MAEHAAGEPPRQGEERHLIAGMVSSLHNEVVIMGLFVVLMTHAGDSVLGLHPREKGDFLKTMIILLFVILFASYYAVTYALDLEHGANLDLTKDPPDLEGGEIFLPILMIPIDLAAVGLSIAIMVALANERVLAGLVGRNKSVRIRGILDKLLILLGLTAAWHLITVLWWIVFGGFGAYTLEPVANDLAFHGFFAGLHLLGMFLVAWMIRAAVGRRMGWAAVAYYCSLLGAVYVLRMHMYIATR